MKNWSVRVGVLTLLLLAGCSTLGRQFRHLVGGAQAGLADDVVIERDEWGVPHIHGRSDAAAVFGAAWAMAEDDFIGLEDGYIQALGRSAYYHGIQYLADDIVRAAFQVETLARSEYDREPESVKRLLQAFAHGLNYYLRKHPERRPRVIGRYEPWMVLARGRALGAEQRVGDLRLGDIAQLVGEPDAGSRPAQPRGGAAWAVAPSRSATGRALLLSTVEAPFFGGDQPYELELRSATGWRVHGLAELGTPVPYSGQNQRLGWGSVPGTSDSAAVLRVVFDHPTDSLAYRVGEGWGRAVAWLDTVHVNTASGVQARSYRFLRTDAGPIISRRGDTAFAVQLPGFRSGGRLQRWLSMSRAGSLVEFTSLLEAKPIPGLATAYGDVEGNILVEAGDGSKPVVNPASGEVHAGRAAAGLPPGDSGWTPAAMARLALGAPDAAAAAEIAGLVDEWEQIGGRDTRRAFAMDSAIELLRRWDLAGLATARRDTTVSAGPSGVNADTVQGAAVTLYHAWREAFGAGAAGQAGTSTANAVAADTTGRFLRFRALEEAVGRLQREWGTVLVPWSEVMRLQRPADVGDPSFRDESPSLPVRGVPVGSLFNLRTIPGASRRRYAIGGTAAVLLSEFTDPPATRSVVVFGQSADPASRHFFDQAGSYTAGELKDAVPRAIQVRERYHPGQRARVLRAETPSR